jgi:hypothetical protein
MQRMRFRDLSGFGGGNYSTGQQLSNPSRSQWTTTVPYQGPVPSKLKIGLSGEQPVCSNMHPLSCYDIP